MNSITITGRNYITVQSKIEYFEGMLTNYGLPMFKSRLDLILHCLELTPVETKLKPAEIRRMRMYSNTSVRMEESFYLGSQMLLYVGTESAPIFPHVLRFFTVYKEFLKEIE